MHDDLVERDFTADTVDELWLTDITEHWTDEGQLYLPPTASPGSRDTICCINVEPQF